MRSHPVTQPARRGQRGFSLIEILVAMVIAMIAVVIMMEVLLSSDQRTRTSNAGNDALGTGAVMLHMLRRDVQQAGYGINTINLLGCNLTTPSGAAGRTGGVSRLAGPGGRRSRGGRAAG